jgi:hypothetical protein
MQSRDLAGIKDSFGNRIRRSAPFDRLRDPSLLGGCVTLSLRSVFPPLSECAQVVPSDVHPASAYHEIDMQAKRIRSGCA